MYIMQWRNQNQHRACVPSLLTPFLFYDITFGYGLYAFGLKGGQAKT